MQLNRLVVHFLMYNKFIPTFKQFNNKSNNSKIKLVNCLNKFKQILIALYKVRKTLFIMIKIHNIMLRIHITIILMLIFVIKMFFIIHKVDIAMEMDMVVTYYLIQNLGEFFSKHNNKILVMIKVFYNMILVSKVFKNI